MPRKRKLSNLSDRCRFCLARDACMKELFDDRLRPKLEDLQKVSGVQILDKANYPKKICYVCLYKVEMWDEFKGQFLKTNKTLITHFKIVEETVPEVNKSLDTANDTADDLHSDDNKKRPKIDSSIVDVDSEIITSPLKTPEKAKTLNINDLSIEPVDNEENAFSSVGKSQLSDNSTSNHRRGRSKKVEREASTKRWEERKNALIAATGEIPSESESDNGSQLSPVQKARVKARNIEMELDKQRKIQKALKNLQTDLTEKYKVSYQDLVDTNERKTRSRQDGNAVNERTTRAQQGSKLNAEEICIVDNVKVNLLKSPLVEKKLEMLNSEKKEQEEDKVEKEKEERKVVKKKEGKKVETVPLEEETVIDITDDLNDQSNEIEVIGNKSGKKPEEVIQKNSPRKSQQMKKLGKAVAKKKFENTIDVIDLEDVDDAMDTSISQNQKSDIPFTPQQLKSEVTLGNATYVVTTILDLPGSTPVASSDTSLKTNGLNIEATSQDGNKIDLMNAVQLQKVSPKEDVKAKNKSGIDAHTCLKIEIEGMEVQALQRVQLDLAHFVSNEVHNRLTESESATKQTKKVNKYKDSYETLNHQLRAIMEKVLRSNFESDKIDMSSSINLGKFSPEFLEAASYSPVFQPKVALTRLNLGKLCKTYNIINLHILEEAKRRRGVVGPLSRTLGKRRPVRPKKFEDFALSVQDEMKLREEEAGKLKNGSKTSTSAAATTASSNSSKPMVTIPSSAVTTVSSTPATKTVAAPKTTPGPASSKLTPAANKVTSVIGSKPVSVVSAKSTTNATNKSTALSASRTAAVTTKSSAVVIKTTTSMTNVTTTTTPNKTPAMRPTIAKITSEIPPKTPQNTAHQVDNLLMEWSDSDQSGNDDPVIQELSTTTFKHFLLPKAVPNQLRELPSTKKLDTSISPMSVTKKTSMSVTKTTVPKTNVPVKPILSTSTPVSKTVQTQQQKVSKPIAPAAATPVSQKYRHVCGLCNKELFSEKEAEAHVKSHKTLSSQMNISLEAAAPKATPGTPAPSKPAVVVSTTSKPALGTPTLNKPGLGTSTPSKPALGTPTPSKPALGTPTASKPTPSKTPTSQGQPSTPKPKLMRCKRCQAIVEADQVKAHVCNSIKFNCTICDCRFGAKHLLDTHMESTHQSPSAKTTQAKSSPTKDKQRMILIQEGNDSKNLQSEENLEDILTDRNASGQEGYSCFVCDKVFVDEVEMKDHLYMHSDEVSDDGDDKGFQCAFCYKKFQTEESLEAHVGNHLRDDGDEKINMLINLNTSRREKKRAMFRCNICTKTFASAMQLALHMQEHEEEAEAQQQEAETDPFVCTICDQIFETGDELSEHLDMHNGNAHVCILCEKPFSSIRDLQEHVSTHL